MLYNRPMDAAGAIQMLILSAQLAGIDAPPIAPLSVAKSKARTAPTSPQLVMRVPLDEIARRQDQAGFDRIAGRGRIHFAIGFDPQAYPWVKLSQGGYSSAYPLSKLKQGVEEAFPAEAYRFLYDHDSIRAVPLDAPQTPQAEVQRMELVENLYHTAARVSFPFVRYAVLYEDGGLVPGSICLLRREGPGHFEVSYHKLEDLKEIEWFLGVSCVLYGIRLEHGSLAFYSKPIPDCEAEPPLTFQSVQAREL